MRNKCYFAQSDSYNQDYSQNYNCNSKKYRIDHNTNKIIRDIKMPHMWKVHSMDGAERLLISIDNVLM